MNEEDQRFMEKNNFQYVDVIGKGGYGVIYKVFVPKYNQVFALKKIPRGKFSKDEISSMIAIESSNIVALYDYYNNGDNIYLLMEFCPESLDTIIAQCRNKIKILTIDQIYNISLGITRALKECHERQIIHGDIKPSNFLIDSYGRIKICDFGLSHKQIGESSNLFSGTLLFLSPEILNKKPYDGYKADVWALGVTLYVIATNGQSPWPLISTHDMTKAIKIGSYNDYELDDINIRYVINRCLDINPEKRPSVKEVYEHLNKCKLMRSPLNIRVKSSKIQPRKLCKPALSSVHIGLGKTPKYASSLRIVHPMRNSSFC